MLIISYNTLKDTTEQLMSKIPRQFQVANFSSRKCFTSCLETKIVGH